MKIVGIILISFCVGCFGFVKASKLQKRYSILRDLLIRFSEAQQRIKLRQEKDIILERLFESPFIIHKNSMLEVSVCCSHLSPQDNILLDEFAKGFGMGDLNSQFEFLKVYKELLNGRAAEAKREQEQKSGMYRTCSVLAAVAVVILLI